MSTRWDREFRKANNARLEELHKVFSDDPSHDPARLHSACSRIDELQAPEVAAMEAHFERRMAHLDALTARITAMLTPFVREDLLRLLLARPTTPATAGSTPRE